MSDEPTTQAFARTLVASLLAAALAGDATSRERTDRFGDPLPPGVVARIGTARWWVGPAEGHYRDSPLVYAPDGKSLAACYEGKAVRFLDAATGKELRRIEPRGEGVTTFALSP